MVTVAGCCKIVNFLNSNETWINTCDKFFSDIFNFFFFLIIIRHFFLQKTIQILRIMVDKRGESLTNLMYYVSIVVDSN